MIRNSSIKLLEQRNLTLLYFIYLNKLIRRSLKMDNLATFLADIYLPEKNDPQDYQMGDPVDYQMGDPMTDVEAQFIDKLLLELGDPDAVIKKISELEQRNIEQGGFGDFFKKLKSKASGVLNVIKKDPSLLINPAGAVSTMVRKVRTDERKKSERKMEQKMEQRNLNKNSGSPTLTIGKDPQKLREITAETGMSYLQVGKNSDLIKPPIPTDARVNPRYFKTVSRMNYSWFPVKPIIITDFIPVGGVLLKIVTPEDNGDKCIFSAISFTFGSNDFQQAAGTTYQTKVDGFDVCGRAWTSGTIKQNLNLNSRIGSLMMIPWIVINSKPYMDALCITKAFVEKFASYNDSTGNPCTAIANTTPLTVEIHGTEKAAVTIQIFTADNDISEAIMSQISA
jgi:hypothetical protein